MQKKDLDKEDIRRLEHIISKKVGIKINRNTIDVRVLFFLKEALQEGVELSYRDLLEIVAVFLHSRCYNRRDIYVLMKLLGVDDSNMQTDLIYMARNWHNRDPFTYVH
jgi:hypothetical protein